MQFRAWLTCLGAALLVTAGCGGDPYKIYPVKGVVVYEDGQPVTGLAGGSVTFMPFADEASRVFSSGTIQEDGRFVLSCKKDGDGAIAGKHRVQIEPPGQEEDTPKKKRTPVRQVVDPSSLELEATVEPTSNDLKLTVKRPVTRSR